MNSIAQYNYYDTEMNSLIKHEQNTKQLTVRLIMTSMTQNEKYNNNINRMKQCDQYDTY